MTISVSEGRGVAEFVSTLSVSEAVTISVSEGRGVAEFVSDN